MTTVKPLGNRVIVEPQEGIKRTEGGIYIPDALQESPPLGTVIAVGDGKVGEPMTVKEGDTVMYSKTTGISITIDKKNYLIMSEADIFGVVTTKDN
jgi:chaperonin GroES